MKQRIKTYKFWVSLSAAVIIFLRALGELFQFEVDEGIVDGVIMGFCGVLVVLGFVTKDENKSDETTESEENKTDENNNIENNNKNDNQK